jgi:primosomal replication protein N
MLITFTGDVIEARAALGSYGSWTITLQDRTSSHSVQVTCPGKLAEVAQKVKVGQVLEVVGWITRVRSGSLPVIPFLLRAKNGVNEADINAMTATYTQSLIEGGDKAKIEAELANVKATLSVSETRMNTAQSELTRLKADFEPLKEENERLRATAEQLDRDLQYERLLKGVMGD